ncbi:MAG: tetratricopeptide repeat protein [Candidatus Melainabacteria bacterium]|nr:tetratricopeptide repeat protein [Candidatus Melainabacteria bacterium]
MAASLLMMRQILTIALILSLSLPAGAYSAQSEVTSLINQGITYHSNRNFVLAIKSFGKAFDLDPENIQIKQNLSIAHNNYGKYLAERTDGPGAAREFRNALYYNRANGVARDNLNYKLKDLEQSVDDQNKRILQAKQERLQENFYAAIAELHEANRIQKTVEAYVEIGTNYHLLSLKSPQDQQFVANAIEAFNAAIAINPDDARPYVKLGDVHVAIGKINQGIDYYEKAIQRNPSNKDAQSALVNGWLAAIRIAPHLANNHIGLGTAYQLRGDFVQAERSFRRALQIDPTNRLALGGLDTLKEDRIKTQVNLFLDRAVVLQKKGQLDESLSHYIKALNLEPSNPDIHYNIGTAFQAKGDMVRARKAYAKTCELFPDHEEAKQALAALSVEEKEQHIAEAFKQAIAYQQKGDYKSAISIYERISVDRPSDDSLFYNMAVAYQALNELDQSIMHYHKAYAIKPDESYSEAIRSVEIAQANALLTEAIGLQSEAKNDEAITLYQKVVKLVPGNANAWYNLGTAYQSVARDSSALNAYQKAYDLDEANQSEAIFFSALILEDQRKLVEAIELYNKYLGLAPTGDYAGEARERQEYIKSFL